jgi:hypothetical protein
MATNAPERWSVRSRMWESRLSGSERALGGGEMSRTSKPTPRATRPDGCGGHRFLRRCRRLSPVAALRQENNATPKCEGRTHPSGSPRPPSAPKGQQVIGRGKRSDALDATPTPKSPVGATGHDRDLCHTTASPRRPSYETCGSHQIKALLSSFIRAFSSCDQPELKGCFPTPRQAPVPNSRTFGAQDVSDPDPSPLDWAEESPTFGGLRFCHLCIRSKDAPLCPTPVLFIAIARAAQGAVIP